MMLLAAGLTLGAAARGEDPAAGDGAASWLVGRWTYANAEGHGRFEFEAGGKVSLEIEATGEGRVDLKGTWEITGATLTIRIDGETVTMRAERLADAGGRAQARFLMEGDDETNVVTWTKDAVQAEEEQPAWLAGTWTTRAALSKRRYVLLPGGDGLVVDTDPKIAKTVPVRWSVKEGRLLLDNPGAAAPIPPLDIVREPDAEGRPCARFVNATQGQLREYAPIFARRPYPATGTAYDGPLVGRWRRRDSAPATSLTLLPDGRFERRRAAAGGAPLEPGTFTTARGSLGDILRLTTAALAEETWVVRIDLEGCLHLRQESGGAEITFDRVSGADEVRRRAAVADARFGHDVLTWEEALAPAALPNLVAPDRETSPGQVDPHPDRVPPGAFVFRRAATWVEVAAGPAEARPAGLAATTAVPVQRTLQWTFGRGGRFSVVASTPQAAAAPPRFGGYTVVGSGIHVTFDDGPEERLTLVDGGRHLVHGRTMLELMDVVTGTTIDSPR